MMSESAPFVGYCTNVHAGINVDAILSNLKTHAQSVRESLALTTLPVGLWFSENAVRESLEPKNLERIRRGIQEMGLLPYTFNGFPQGDFHSAIVKHRVYLPPWWEPSRLKYTQDLIRLLDQLLEPERFGSISTLPIAWGTPKPTSDQWQAATLQLITLAEQLHQLYEASGRRMVLAIEPEPGCAITDTASLRQFFADHLCEQKLGSSRAERIRNYITMCHDVCHAAVMAENQETELAACRSEGIRIGKIQISSAICVAWDKLDEAGRAAALEELRQFAEDRYLHQTLVRLPDHSVQLIEDLPGLLADLSGLEDPRTRKEWRIHFHVPIDVASWGRIETTQNEIDRFLDLMIEQKDFGSPEMHLEVETYAWGVLPESMRERQLHQGIARELQWLHRRLLAKVQSNGVEHHA